MKLKAEYANMVFGTGVGLLTFFIQPLVGTMSDNCTLKLGRRRPFIIIGAIISSFGMLLMGQSPAIGKFLGDPKDPSDESIHLWGLFIAFIGSVCGAIGNAFLIVPSKALVCEVIPVQEQHPVQLIGVMIDEINNFVYFIFAAFLSETENFYQIIYGIGIATVLITSLITVFVTKEKKAHRHRACCKQVIGIARDIKHCPKKLWLLFLVIILFFIAMGPFMTNLNNFVGTNLFHGDAMANDSNYKQGIQMSLFSLAIASVISSVCSFVFPIIVKNHEIPFYIISIFFTIISFVGYTLLNWYAQSENSSTSITSVLLVIITSFLHISIIGPNSVPWAVFKQVCPQQKFGVYNGLFGSFIMLSNVVAGFISGLLVDLFNDLVVLYVLQEVCMGIAFFASFIMIYINKGTKELDIVSYHSLDDTTTIIEDDEIQERELSVTNEKDHSFDSVDEDDVAQQIQIIADQMNEKSPLKLNDE